MKFCPHCGSKLVIENSRFCQECGLELESLPASREGLETAVVPPTAQAVTGEPVRSSAQAHSFGDAHAAAFFPAPVSPPGRLSAWFWAGCIALVLSFGFWLLPVFGGTPTLSTGFTAVDVILIAGFLNAHLFRRTGRRRLIGFVFGVVVSIALLWCLKVALGGAYRMGVVPGPAAAKTSGATVPSEGAKPHIDPKGWTEESTGSTEPGPWLKFSPAGTRYYQDAKGVIYRLYPPGVKPDAEPANPFGVIDSTAEPPAPVRVRP
ncbi:zinc ribbon domain-containing protein [Variovorax saccharolyticus]|uniref:zinc ribbon domain-containing protein n=1 Tax=Variovorax saccharolyticus TaxID=3053516 RepID=UPI002578B5EB|nr:zinc ribbon domain-containing protein [Variovorax sp. J22R187]MDM0018028.1 zinc ribbon domain-containing protein [Variovorax sp. J22R187]